MAEPVLVRRRWDSVHILLVRIRGILDHRAGGLVLTLDHFDSATSTCIVSPKNWGLLGGSPRGRYVRAYLGHAMFRLLGF